LDFFNWDEDPVFYSGIILCLLAAVLYFVRVKRPRHMEIDTHDPDTPDEKQERNREKTLGILRRIFTDRQAWATFLCHFGVVGTYIGFIGSWAVPYGMHMYAMTCSDASQLIMMGLIGAIIGAPLTSWVSSRIGSIKRSYITVHMIVLVSWVAFLLFNGKPPYAVLVVLFFLIGYGSGASALTFVIVRKSFNIKEVGVVSGFANTGGFLSAVLYQVFSGKSWISSIWWT
jgi:sugar phosphate permease